MLPYKLADVIARVESGNFAGAIRYEEASHANIVARFGSYASIAQNAMTANKCNQSTACVLLATSWGKFQIMGFNLYASDVCNIREPLSAYLANEPFQEMSFNKYCVARHCDTYDVAALRTSLQTRSDFARLYNGTGNIPAYASKIFGAIVALDND